MSVVTANGDLLSLLELHVPHRGAWWARIEYIDQPDLEDGAPVELMIDELRLVGTMIPERSGTDNGHRSALVFAGAAGWGVEVAPQHYRSDTGVRARLVAEDAARAAGETLGGFAPAAERLGPHYVRQSGLARRVLEDAIGDVLWWVDYDGVTQVGAERPEVEVTSDTHRVLEYDPLERVATLELQDPRGIVIGSRLVEGVDVPQVVRELDLKASVRGLRLQVWCGPGRYGLADSQAFAMVRRYSEAHLWGSWRYRVTRMNGDKIDARPVLSAHGLPELVGIELSPGAPGIDAVLPAGLEVLVEFVEGDRALPRVVGFAGHDQATWTPTRITLEGDVIEIGKNATKGIARTNDAVYVTIPAMSVCVGVVAGAAVMNPAAIVLSGEITGGSTKAKAS